MKELGPLRFGANPSAQLVEPVKAATVAGPTGTYSFTMTLGNSGDAQLRLGSIYILSPTGGTANIDWGNGSGGVITLVKNINYGINTPSTGSRVTISGRNAANITDLTLRSGYTTITGITGTYPSTLTSLTVSFTYENPTFTIPNTLTSLSFSNVVGPSSITTPPTLKVLSSVTYNLTVLDLSKSPLITSLPSNLESLEKLTTLRTGAGLLTLSKLPKSLTTLVCTASTKLQTVDLSTISLSAIPTLPSSVTSLKTPPGLTTLSGLPSSLTSLDLSGSTGLTSVNLSGLTKLVSLPGLPISCNTLNLTGCTGMKSVRLDPSIVKIATFTRSGITKPPLLVIPSDCTYTF